MKAVFVDTGAFLAKEIAADQHHEAAASAWRDLADQRIVMYSSEHILDESTTLLARRTNYAWAAGWGVDVLNAGIRWLKSDRTDLEAAFRLMRKFADQGVSFTDCLSFALMHRERVRSVFGFDRHFVAAGFNIWPK